MKTKTDSMFVQLTNVIEKGFTAIAGDFADMRERFDSLENRFDSLEEEVHGIRIELSHINNRLEMLEERGASSAGFAKEIDHAFSLIASMEKRLKVIEKAQL